MISRVTLYRVSAALFLLAAALVAPESTLPARDAAAGAMWQVLRRRVEAAEAAAGGGGSSTAARRCAQRRCARRRRGAHAQAPAPATRI